MKKRYVLFSASRKSNNKICKECFKRYGIEVELSPKKNLDQIYHELKYVNNEKLNKKLLAYLLFHTELLNLDNTKLQYPFNSLSEIILKNQLTAYYIKDGNLVSSSYTKSIKGYAKEKIIKEPLEPLDHFFVPKHSTNFIHLNKEPCHQLISDYICDHIHYSKPINLRFNPLKRKRTIDFEEDPAHFVLNDPLYLNQWSKKIGSCNVFIETLNRGVFFRSAKNRREKNYWLPGLNAGLPLTPKKDWIHERCFMAHDFGHFVIPDLICVGNHNHIFKQIYITHRMMSEAFTLVMTDMVFVDTIKRSGFNYDFTQRKIYPLFEDLNIDLSDKGQFVLNLKKILKANVSFCLRGDESEFRNIIKKRGNSFENFNRFRKKYIPFFVEDYRWTEKNYQYFKKKNTIFQKWWDISRQIKDIVPLGLETVEEFSKKIQHYPGDIIDQVFEELFGRIIKIYQASDIKLDSASNRLKKAFYRYMIGQLALFRRFNPIYPELEKIERKILDLLHLYQYKPFNEDAIVNCRNLYEYAVNKLEINGIISSDDSKIFKEFYPLFEPYFVHYDEDFSYYPDLSLESKRILYGSL